MSHLPFWEPGSGHYGNTLGQTNRQIVTACRDMVLPWLDTVPVRKDGVFTIADYGTSDGYSSMPLIENMIDHLRKKHGDDLAIQIIYEDQEQNDFNSLFKRLSDDTSYMTKFRNVYPMATNVNFYKQCVPDGTCDIMLTSMTMHWLQTSTTTFKDAVFLEMATKDERARFSVEGERDLSKFLLLRARELRQGGLLVAVNLTRADDDCDEDKALTATLYTGEQKKTHVKVPGRNDVQWELDRAWRELKEEAIITQEEYEGCTVKAMIRTAQECKAPFEKETSEVRQAGLTLVYFDQILFTCAPKARWLESQGKDTNEAEERERFAKGTATSERVWSNSSFHSALSDMRTEEEKAAILDHLYKKYQARVMSRNPRSFNCDRFLSRLVARKV